MSFCPRRTIWQFRDAWPSLCLNQEMPCNCGSIIRGHRAVFETMLPFSVDTGSAGNVSWFQDAISWAVAKTLMGFRTRDMGGAT